MIHVVVQRRREETIRLEVVPGDHLGIEGVDDHRHDRDDALVHRADSQVVQPRFDPPETTNWSTFRRPPASLARNSWMASMARTPLLTIARRTSQVSSFVVKCFTRV